MKRYHSAVADNDGLSIIGNVVVNLEDPGSGPGPNGRITFSEMSGLLPAVFKPALTADFQIDGLKLSANVGETTLGALRVSLNEHVTKPGELTQLLKVHTSLLKFFIDNCKFFIGAL